MCFVIQVSHILCSGYCCNVCKVLTLFVILSDVILGDKCLQDAESEMLPDYGEIVFHTDMENGLSSMTWKYREQRIIDRLSVMPVPFSISAVYDMIDHSFQVFTLLLNY